jgi:hypothetical protein
MLDGVGRTEVNQKAGRDGLVALLPSSCPSGRTNSTLESVSGYLQISS